MKLLVCIVCGDMNTLSYQTKKCSCGKTGGRYNSDGDTVTIWGTDTTGKLLGLNNRAIYHALAGSRITDEQGLGGVLWPYPMDNGKITVRDDITGGDHGEGRGA